MAANLLNSSHAVAMSVYVIRAFVSLHRNAATDAAILKRLAEIDKPLVTGEPKPADERDRSGVRSLFGWNP